MLNRGMPRSTVIPVLLYPNVQVASQGEPQKSSISIMLHVDECGRALSSGACDRREGEWSTCVVPVLSYPYGERQYSAIDLAGYEWTFSQSVADVDPALWGGVLKGDR